VPKIRYFFGVSTPISNQRQFIVSFLLTYQKVPKMLKNKPQNGEKMTLVIGANCKDGVVIISDKKVVEGVDIASHPKIYLVDALGVGFSGAGISELFDKFLARVFINLEERKKQIKKQMQEQNPKITQEELDAIISPYAYANQFVEDCEGILFQMKNQYKDIMEKYPNGLQLLIAFRSGREAELHKLEIADCLDSKRKTFLAIGSGSPYAQTFLKAMWSDEITMEEMAKLGCFIINYIEESKIDNYVGEGVQILYVPKTNDAFLKLVSKTNRSVEEENEFKKYLVKLENDGNLSFPKTKKIVANFKKSFDSLKKSLK